MRGGALILTPLYGADGQIYAMAQGNLAVGGLGVSGSDGSQADRQRPDRRAALPMAPASNAPWRPVSTSAQSLRFNLHQADFLTASRVRDAINARYPGMAHDRGRGHARAEPAAGR